MSDEELTLEFMSELRNLFGKYKPKIRKGEILIYSVLVHVISGAKIASLSDKHFEHFMQIVMEGVGEESIAMRNFLDGRSNN